jgi:perosamine synthetase
MSRRALPFPKWFDDMTDFSSGPTMNETRPTRFGWILALGDWLGDEYGAGPYPLHRPVFNGNEHAYLRECIDSNFVSSVGQRVNDIERMVAEFTGANYAIATVNGTAALHAALHVVGVSRGDEVLTQALTFVATCNAIAYTGAKPVFVDVDQDTLGMSPAALEQFLGEHCESRDGACFNRQTGARVRACLPMHTFGFPCRIEAIAAICRNHGIELIEDAAESLGSYSGDHHTGTFGRMATLSFNGNKIITTGGGGMVITDDEELARRLKHLTTTAKQPHAWEFRHDELGFNYRMPNLNAALGCAQMEQLDGFLAAKRKLTELYAEFFRGQGVTMVSEREGTRANLWLNAIVLDDPTARDGLLQQANDAGIMMRPIWRLMTDLAMYADCQHDGLANSRWAEARVINLPSSVP